MFLLHALKPGSFSNVVHTGALVPKYSHFSQKDAVWVSALPKLEDKLYSHKYSIWNDKYLFHNTGPVLVFHEDLLYHINPEIEIFYKQSTRRKTIYNIDELEKHISMYYNDPQHKENTLHHNRWSSSHEIRFRKPVPLDFLKCVLVYNSSHIYDLCENKSSWPVYKVNYLIHTATTFYDMYNLIK